jgi:selenocysteine-specific elongation factor
MIDARLDLLASAAKPLKQRARVRLHHGTAEVMARVLLLNAQPGVSAVEPGGSALVQLRLEEMITALPGDRFIIRSYSPQVTIGGGVVIDALPEKHRIRDQEARARLEHLEQADPAEQAATFVEMAGNRGMTTPDLAARTGVTDDQLARLKQALVQSGRLLEVPASPAMLVSSAAFGNLASKVLALLEEHHRREPLSLGINREEVRERVFGNIAPEIFKTVVMRLSGQEKIAAERDSLLRLKSHNPSLSNADAAAKQRLESAIKATGLQAGTLEEVSASAGIRIDLARKLYNLLNVENRVVRVGDMVFHSESLSDLKERVRGRKNTNSKMDVATFKEVTGGLTRKHAIPLLEYLDRERITRRVGNEREIL